jgi:hypothetical protein
MLILCYPAVAEVPPTNLTAPKKHEAVLSSIAVRGCIFLLSIPSVPID